MRLEPIFIECLKEMCRREQISLAAFVRHVYELNGKRGKISAKLRCFVLEYFKDAATDAGHDQAGHGKAPLKQTQPSQHVASKAHNTWIH